MTDLPWEFTHRFRQHNRHVMIAVLLCLAGTLFLLNAIYFFLHWMALFFTTAVLGEGGYVPSWLPSLYIALITGLFLWGAIDENCRRFQTPTDRPILGLHSIRDILLILPRLAFGILGNLNAFIRLNNSDMRQAWNLLRGIYEMKRADISKLSLLEPDPALRHKLLTSLQLVGYIDLHHGEEGSFYLIRSTELPGLTPLLLP